MIAQRDDITAPRLTPTLPLNTILCGDALDVLRSLPDASVDAIVTDPPYFRVKGEAWDRQWDSAAAFLGWMAQLRDEWARVLKPNGSLYVFASPRMAARVEVCIGERFNVLNSLVWQKETDRGKHAHTCKEALRSYFPNTERIIFAEHYGADSMALGESGYAAMCEKTHGHVFEPLRAYLAGELKRAGVKPEWCNEACGTRSMAARHYFTRSQWQLPTAPHYAALQRMFNERGRRPAPPFADFHPAGSPFARLHERAQIAEYLRVDYEDLRADYEDLRRPFSVTADVPYTDVWDFATVPYRPGKHVCEKPLDLMRHIIRSSTREGAVVLDCFAGSGATLEAALLEGRHYLGIERDPRYVAQAETRLMRRPAQTVANVVVRTRKHLPQRPQPRTLWEVAL